MFQTCDTCGVEVNPAKTIGPSTCIEFLGILIDSEAMELRMSESQLSAIKTELQSWLGRKTGKKRELLSLIGKLVFLSRVIQPGRIFLRRLITMSMKGKQLFHKIRLSSDAKDDILWWLSCADAWNSKSVFLNDFWSSSGDLQMYTDASGTGIGGVLGTYWYLDYLSPAEQTKSIAWRELLAVVVACRTWGSLLTGLRIQLFCDNESVVSIVNSGSSKCGEIMALVRSLFFIAVKFNFDIRLRHVSGVLNIDADLLSRGRLDEFLKLRGGRCAAAPTTASRDFGV